MIRQPVTGSSVLFLTSTLALDGQVVDGSALLRDGLTLPTRKQFDSAVIEITAGGP